MVARQNKYIFGIILFYKADILINRICRALIPFAAVRLDIGRQDTYTAVKPV